GASPAHDAADGEPVRLYGHAELARGPIEGDDRVRALAHERPRPSARAVANAAGLWPAKGHGARELSSAAPLQLVPHRFGVADPERLQTGDVAVHPAHLDARASGSLARPLERPRDAVYAGHAPTPLGQVDGVAPGAAADVERAPGRGVALAELDHRRGRLLALPGRDSQPVQERVGVHDRRP